MTTTETLATFAGGCFWCMVEPFDQQPGIVSIVSGYTGGTVTNPTYEQVATNTTGHREAVQITFESDKISYEQLIDIFWQQIDPTDPSGQFNDRGESYQTAIFYHDDTQKNIAEQSKKALQESGKFNKPIVTEIIPATHFHSAEPEHQDYHKQNPTHYQMYKKGSGREDFIQENWEQKQSENDLETKLTPMQFHVTQEEGTEPPFQNEYWDHEEEGIYVNIVSGEVLFTSREKYDAQCGWPSFVKPADGSELVEKVDTSHGMIRTEVRGKDDNSHIGHVFNDGPPERGGLRYCMNSAAMKFIPKNDMTEKGYSEYLHLLDS